jgi:PBP1b-binding outer membrane lipoprotein LpoB
MKKTSIYSYFIFSFLFLIFLNGCKPGETINPSAFNPSMSAIINGVNWSSTSIVTTTSRITTTPINSTVPSSIVYLKVVVGKDNSYQLGISFHDTVSAKTYDLDESKSWYPNTIIYDNNSKELYNNQTGKLRFSKVDNINRRIEGSFDFIGLMNSTVTSKTITVSGGSFSLDY